MKRKRGSGPVHSHTALLTLVLCTTLAVVTAASNSHNTHNTHNTHKLPQSSAEWYGDEVAVRGSGTPGTCAFPCGSNLCCQNGDCSKAACQCQYGWNGTNCQNPVCAHGGTATAFNHNAPDGESFYQCNCTDGWLGPNCLVCGKSSVCEGEKSYCDTTPYSYGDKNFECAVTSKTWQNLLGGGGFVTMQCSGFTTKTNTSAPAHPTGECVMNMYETQVNNAGVTFNPQLATGIMSECYSELSGTKKDEVVVYTCNKIVAECAYKATYRLCGAEFDEIMNKFAGKTVITCDTKKTNGGYVCSFEQTTNSNVIGLQCRLGECMDHKPNSPKLPPARLSGLEIGGIVAVCCGLAVLVGAFMRWCVCFSMRTSAAAEGSDSEALISNMVPAPCSVSIRNVSLTRIETGWLPWSPFAHKKILHRVYGDVAPGQILALMGASGAGKTTLLDTVAMRIASGHDTCSGKGAVVLGDVLVNGHHVSKADLRAVAGYVQQDDALMGTMTVRETVMFSAILRLPATMSAAQKEARVDAVLKELGIAHISDSIIGDAFVRGISGGERRRVSIALELVTSPSILFLDEPTSGLDSHTALTVMKSLRDLADRGHTIVCSIHQPSSAIFHLIDRLLLLRGGRVMYSGPAAEAVPAFAALDFVCPSAFNPADFLIEVIQDASDAVAERFRAAARAAQAVYVGQEDGSGGGGSGSTSTNGGGSSGKGKGSGDHEIDDDKAALLSGSTNSVDYGSATSRGRSGTGFDPAIIEARKDTGAGLLKQFDLLCWRTAANFIRDPFLMLAHYLIFIALALLIGGIYYQLGIDLIAVQDRLGAFFFMCALLSFGSVSSLELFMKERAIFIRERANGYYHPSTYFMAKVFFELVPVRVFPTMIFATISYWMMGLRAEYSYFAYFLLALTLLHLTCAAFCLFIGVSIRSFGLANLTASLSMLMFMLFGGFLVNPVNMAKAVSWITYTSPFSYAFKVLMINELDGLVMNFNPPNNPSFTVDASIFLTQFGIKPEMFVADLSILGSMFGALLILAYVILWAFVRERR